MKNSDLKLIRDYLDGRHTPEGLERLNELLETDPGARAEFRTMATLEEGLRDLSVVSDSLLPMPEGHVADNHKERLLLGYLGLAALVLVSLGLAILQSRQGGDAIGWEDAIARIEHLSDDARFGSNHQLSDEEGGLLGKGWVYLKQGGMRILFRSGATMELEGPAAVGIDTPLRAYLDFGRVRVHAPDSVRDFVVATESMEVVDLGTRFEVGVNPESRESRVSVTEGLVDLHLGSRGTDRIIRPLEAGYAARVDGSGRIVEITDEPEAVLGDQPESVRLVAHWTFDEGIFNASAHDSGGRNLHGSLVPENLPEPLPGVSGQALSFSKGQYVDLAEHLPALEKLNAFTIAALVRNPAEPLAMIFSLSGESEQHRVQFHLLRRFVVFGWQDGLHYDAISGRVDDWQADRWYHVAAAVQDGAVRLYLDGELVSSGSIGSRIGTPVSFPSRVEAPAFAYIGRLEDGRQGEDAAAQCFEGEIDDVQIYSGAISQGEIQSLFANPGQSLQLDTNEHRKEQ